MNWEANAAKLAAQLCEELITRSIMPVIKEKTIVLDDSIAGSKLSVHESLPVLRNALKDAGIDYKMILVKGEEIIVDDKRSEERLKEELKVLFMCPHCGFVTIDEELYWMHLKSHYFMTP